MKRNLTRLGAIAAALVLAGGCSATGGRRAVEAAGKGGGGGCGSSVMKVALITHQAPGDTFWDIVRKGAEQAAANDCVDLEYSADPDATKQAQLVQAAIDKKVDGIALTDPNNGAMKGVIGKAVRGGIPVSMLNAGGPYAQKLGAIGYFGQGETDAGQAVGKRLLTEGAKDVICVIHAQGQQQLEDRCAGVASGASGVKVKRVYVNGQDDSAATSTVQATLTSDRNVDHVVTLGAPFALDSAKAVKAAGSKAKIGTFDTNPQLIAAIKDGSVAWAVDQQPYLQGYLAVEAQYLYKINGNIMGGGKNVPTGPAFIDAKNVEQVSNFAAKGTR